MAQNREGVCQGVWPTLMMTTMSLPMKLMRPSSSSPCRGRYSPVGPESTMREGAGLDGGGGACLHEDKEGSKEE